MSNLFTEFKRLIPDAPLLVGTITASADNVATIALPDGGVLTARGGGAVDDVVFVRGGMIEGAAPGLEAVLIEV